MKQIRINCRLDSRYEFPFSQEFFRPSELEIFLQNHLDLSVNEVILVDEYKMTLEQKTFLKSKVNDILNSHKKNRSRYLYDQEHMVRTLEERKRQIKKRMRKESIEKKKRRFDFHIDEIPANPRDRENWEKKKKEKTKDYFAMNEGTP